MQSKSTRCSLTALSAIPIARSILAAPFAPCLKMWTYTKGINIIGGDYSTRLSYNSLYSLCLNEQSRHWGLGRQYPVIIPLTLAPGLYDVNIWDLGQKGLVKFKFLELSPLFFAFGCSRAFKWTANSRMAKFWTRTTENTKPSQRALQRSCI